MTRRKGRYNTPQFSALGILYGKSHYSTPLISPSIILYQVPCIFHHPTLPFGFLCSEGLGGCRVREEGLYAVYMVCNVGFSRDDNMLVKYSGRSILCGVDASPAVSFPASSKWQHQKNTPVILSLTPAQTLYIIFPSSAFSVPASGELGVVPKDEGIGDFKCSCI